MGVLPVLIQTAPSSAQCTPVELQKLTASDAAANDFLGYYVAIDGDTAVITALGDDNAGGIDAGAAYVFIRTGASWTQQAKLTASDGVAADQFGNSAAISGNTIVIGTLSDDTGAGLDVGSAYVFVRSGTVWSQQAKLTASDAVAFDRFGGSVTIFVDSIVVGASQADAGAADAGAAYVYTRSGTVWSQQAKLIPGDPLGGSFFGVSVSVSGDSAAIGRHGDTTGSAYVFTRSGTVWSQQQKVNAADAASSDQFGISVAIQANTMLVGSHKDDNAGGSNAGSAYAFTRSGTVWTQQAKITASDAVTQDSFGQSVGLDGDMAVIGALLDDHVGGTSDGSAYVYTRNGTVWTQRAKLTASDAAPDDTYGRVAVSDGTAISGAYVETNPGGAFAGSAYVYALNCDSDGDGVFDENDVCPNTQVGAPVDATGRPLRDCNLDCVFNAVDIQCIVDELLGL